MGERIDLQALLEDVLGSSNVYFQPPNGYKLSYPCIVYNREKIDTRFADGKPYFHSNRYSVTLIERDPDSDLPHKMTELPMCVHDRYFASDNLHHNVFTIYY